MLTASELAGIRETSEENLPDVCNVVDLAPTRDAYGDVIEGAITGPDFACKVKPVSSGSRSSDVEAVIMERLGVLEAWTIAAPRSVEIPLEASVLVDVGGQTRMLQVVASPGPKSYEAVHRFVATELR